MKTYSASIIAIIASLTVVACDQTRPSEISADVTAEQTDPRAPKPPGCKTLVDMGHYSRMKELDVTGLTIDTAVESFSEAFEKSDDTLVLQNKHKVNKCWINLVHVKNIPQTENGPRQIIYNLLSEEDALDNALSYAGVKMTCWKDETEVWHEVTSCDDVKRK